MGTKSLGPVTPTGTERSGNVLRDAWVATGAGVGGILAGMLVISISEEGSLLALVGALLLLVAGLVGLIVGIVWSVRAIRQGRAVAIAPLLLDGFLLFHGLVAMLAAFGLYYGWDA
ncbi:MAG: hypothetical protein MUF09_07355 [Candidatus Nanopelagicales bacterium]|jgi:hypothetical protein|nr:hypothetical protein [Candidatus Nanopelagicales bacterium]